MRVLSTHERCHLLVFICDGIGPTTLVAQRNGKVITLDFSDLWRFDGARPVAYQPGVDESARYARESQIKRGALYTLADAQASTRCVLPEEKNAAVLRYSPEQAR